MSKFLSDRDKHVFIIDFLLSDKTCGDLAAERKKEELKAIVQYVRNDVPDELAMTDRHLYAALRKRVTELKMCGVGIKRMHEHNNPKVIDAPNEAFQFVQEHLQPLSAEMLEKHTTGKFKRGGLLMQLIAMCAKNIPDGLKIAESLLFKATMEAVARQEPDESQSPSVF